ncbi:twin-arginine translocation signal domain-containing protein [Halomicrococcus sp. SG-WS-1]|uniref:twin-arginine translocation signal domain-containing protein n=1 Tax=Halomicrococcus sp. SG-WS-1 TaxID=3439057 RepID=UPI003F79ED07
MTEHTLARLLGEPSRRSFLKTSALASGGAALGLSGVGGAQDGDTRRAVILNRQFSGGARFSIASDSLGWAPIENDAQGNEYNTRVINYQFSPGAYAMLFLPSGVDVQEGQTYEFQTGLGDFNFDGNAVDDDIVFDDPGEIGLVGVQFTPVEGGATTQAGNQTAGNQTDG